MLVPRAGGSWVTLTPQLVTLTPHSWHPSALTLSTIIPDFQAVAAQVPLLSQDSRPASFPAMGILSLRVTAAAEVSLRCVPVGLWARLGWTFPTPFPSLSPSALPVPSSWHCHQSLGQGAPAQGSAAHTGVTAVLEHSQHRGVGWMGAKTAWKWEFPLLLKVAAFPGNLNWERSVFHAVGKFFTGTKAAADPGCPSQVHPIPTSPPHGSATISPCQLLIPAQGGRKKKKKSHLMQTKVV